MQLWPARHARDAVLTAAAARRLDAATIEQGIPSIELMERAGEAIADHILELAQLNAGPRIERFLRACQMDEAAEDAGDDAGGRATERSSLRDLPGRAGEALILCGAGNNGGDGFVVARLLTDEAWDVSVGLCLGEPREGGGAARNLQRWKNSGGQVLDYAGVLCALSTADDRPLLLVDCLLGTGTDRATGGELARLIDRMRGSDLPVVAVDLPTGLCADTGRELGTAVVADATITLGAAKPGLFLRRGPHHSGRVRVAEIGLLPPRTGGVAAQAVVLSGELCSQLVRPRSWMVHKGTRGRVLICGGFEGRSGAPILAARGALRAGGGLVSVASARGAALALTVNLPEAMAVALDESSDGCPGPGAAAQLLQASSGTDALVVGPGLGTSDGAAALVESLLRSFAGSLVLDADALNLIAAGGDELIKLLDRPAPTILTPHPGEMARLCGLDTAAVQADRDQIAKDFTARSGATLVLKGAGTIIAQRPDRIAINSSGNPGMAGPGMGDVLAGVIGALLACRAPVLPQGSAGSEDLSSDAFETACLAVYLHGEAADGLYGELSAGGFLASEVADRIPDALASLATVSNAAQDTP